MSTFKLEDALKAGVINVYKTKTPDQYVLVILGKTQSYVVPLIKNEIGTVAYVSPSYPAIAYPKISEIVNMVINSSDVYDGLYKYTPMRDAIPEHCKEIESFLPFKKKGARKGKGADAELSKAGYILPTVDALKTSVPTKNYADLVARDPEAKARVEENEVFMKSLNISYDDLDKEIKTAYQGAAFGQSLGIIFTGPAGTGKTTAAKVLAYKDKAPFLQMPITYGTSIEDLIGMFTPNDDSTDLSFAQSHIHKLYSDLNQFPRTSTESDADYNKRFQEACDSAFAQVMSTVSSTGGSAKWKFVPGPLLKSYYEGWQLLLDEINYGQPGVNACLNMFLDGTERIIVHGKTYKKHPNFFCYMTMNPGYQGTEPLNDALKNRFTICEIGALTKAEFCKRAIAYSGKIGHKLSKTLFERLYDFAGTIQEASKGTQFKRENVVFSIRNAFRLCDCILSKVCSYEEFKCAVYIQYINALNCNNDNSDQLNKIKGKGKYKAPDSDIENSIKAMYDAYDFAAAEEVESTMDFEDMFVEASSGSSSGKKDDGLAFGEEIWDSIKEDE